MEITRHIEREIIKLQTENDRLIKQLRSSDAVQRDVSGENFLMKTNTAEIKQLRMEVEELRVRRKKQDIANEKAIQEALEQRSQDRTIFKRYSGNELVQLFESRAIELSRKSMSLSHSIQQAKRTLNRNQQLLKEMTDICSNDYLPTDTDCMQKNISQYQQFIALKCAIERAPAEVTHEKNNCDAETNFSNKSEKELKNMVKDISILIEATGSKYLREIESHIFEQKSMQEDMLELKKKAEKRLQDLKAEKLEVSSKMSLVKENDHRRTINVESVYLARSHLKEQEARRNTAITDRESLNAVSSKARYKLINLITRINPKINMEKLSHLNLEELASYAENVIILKCSENNPLKLTSRKSKIAAGNDLKKVTGRSHSEEK